MARHGQRALSDSSGVHHVGEGPERPSVAARGGGGGGVVAFTMHQLSAISTVSLPVPSGCLVPGTHQGPNCGLGSQGSGCPEEGVMAGHRDRRGLCLEWSQHSRNPTCSVEGGARGPGAHRRLPGRAGGRARSSGLSRDARQRGRQPRARPLQMGDASPASRRAVGLLLGNKVGPESRGPPRGGQPLHGGPATESQPPAWTPL